jgi:hypothetical protein
VVFNLLYVKTLYIYIYEAIRVVITSSKSKAFKDKSLLFTNIKFFFLNNILNNISIFIKATIKLQAENYPIILLLLLLYLTPIS